MSEYSSGLNLRPTTAAGSGNWYLLQLLNNDSQLPGSTPLHLVINDLQSINGQCLIPVITTKTEPRTQQVYESNIEEPAIPLQCISGQELKQLSNSKKLQIGTNVSIKEESLTNNVTIRTHPKPVISNKNPKKKRNTNIKLKNEIKPAQENKKFFCAHIPDREIPPRAIAVLPEELQIRRDCIWPRRPLPPRVRFGPVLGLSTRIFIAEAEELALEAAISKTPMFLMRREEESVFHIDVSNKDRANWLSLLPLGDESTANVWLYEEENELFAITTKVIHPRTPMALGYSKKYAEDHKLPPGQPLLDLEDVFAIEPKEFWCFECRRSMSSAALLERHKIVYHKDNLLQRLHRCPHCARTFTRLFTLKKHLRETCTKKYSKTDSNIKETTAEPEPDPYEQTAEEHRIPSDESFQNYTNGLDFSTNLFDTDRISNLDISGSSRSDLDFNPYPNLDDMINSKTEKYTKKQVKTAEPIFTSCPHCEQTIPKNKTRKHVSECQARHFECECGQVYTNKSKLAEHVHSTHSERLRIEAGVKLEVKNKEESKVTRASDETEYKCDDCKLKFKRRGMLVNHLWKIHKPAAVSVPMERTVRYYPCTVCQKIYRTAAKRDQHFKVHHPGAEFIRASIEGGRRSCEPAACSACPRQYATRSKLLQHVRARHPHLAAQISTETAKQSKKSTPKKKPPANQSPTSASTTLLQTFPFH